MKNSVCSMMLVGLTIFSCAATWFVGCGSTDKVGEGNGGGGGVGGPVVINPTPIGSGQGASTGSGASSGSGSSGGTGTSATPTGDVNCGSTISSTSHEPADVLLVLDRSGSMNYSIAADCYCSRQAAGSSGTVCPNTSNCTTRWPALTTAVNATLTSATSIHWGLKLFTSPGSNECGVNRGVEVGIGDNSAGAIQSQIAGVSPSNATPTAAAITAATNYLKTVTDPNNKVILLATDGEPNCANGSANTTDVQGTVKAIAAAKSAGFLVYVIGIGPSVGNLDSFASAGGTGKYYPATSSADLASALESIKKSVTTCTFTSPTAPPDPNNVAVYLDKNLVPKDDNNGWSFGANNQTFVLNGSTCAKITSGAASNVQILFGCPLVPGDTPPPPPPTTIP